MKFINIIHKTYVTQSSKLLSKKVSEIDKTLQVLGSSTSFNNIYKMTIMNITIAILYLFLFFITIIVWMTILNNPIYKSFMLYLSLMLNIYTFMVKFILLIEFFTIIRYVLLLRINIFHFDYKLKIFNYLRCIESEFRRANDLLSDVNVLPISSIASELLEHKKADGSLSIESSLPVDSKKLFIGQSSLCRLQSQLQVENYKINKSRRLLRTIR